MNQEQVSGIWMQVFGRLKQHWGVLTNRADIIVAGTRDQLDGEAQEQYGALIEKSANQLQDFQEQHRHWELLDR